MKKLLKENLKIIIIVLITTVVATTTTIFAYSLIAENVGYTPKDTTWNVENVEAALNNLNLRENQLDTHLSTEEQVVGEWIDGKPLYQKTISFEVSKINTQILNSLGSFNINDVESVKNVYGYQEYSGVTTNYLPIVYSYANGDRASFWVTNNTFHFISTYTGRVYATLQYTKTTD